MRMRSVLANLKRTPGVGLSAVLFVGCVLLATKPFPGAEAQFGRGVGRFFRNFQRGATTVFRPMFRPIVSNVQPMFKPIVSNVQPMFRPQQFSMASMFSNRPRFPFLPQR